MATPAVVWLIATRTWRGAAFIIGLIMWAVSIPLSLVLRHRPEPYGYLPAGILMDVSRRTGIAASRIYGVATFYEQFYLQPHGRHTIRCCRGTACHVKGGPNIIKSLKQTLGVEPGETTEDMRYTLETVACLGTCFLAPVMMVNNDYYGHLNARKIKTILERYA